MKSRIKKPKLVDKTTTIPFIYLWVNIISRKWYLGSRTEIGCHPYDGYICSSEIVYPMIESAPYEWRRLIIEIGKTPKEVRARECYLLTLLNARMDPMSYNKTNGSLDFSTADTICISKNGREKYIHQGNLSHFLDEGWITGRSDDSRNKISQTMKKVRNLEPDKWTSREGIDNSSSCEWLLISPDNDIYHFFGGFRPKCKELGISHVTMELAYKQGWIPKKGKCSGWMVFNITHMLGTVDVPKNFGIHRSGTNNPSYKSKLKRQQINNNVL